MRLQDAHTAKTVNLLPALPALVRKCGIKISEKSDYKRDMYKGKQRREMQKLEVKKIIVGMGVTGLSVARYFHARNIAFTVYDSRDHVASLETVEQMTSAHGVHCGQWQSSYLDGIEQMVLSPGLSVEMDLVREAKRRGIEVIGDIELFAREVKAPVIAITGSNGKSTVTDLMGKLLAACGYRVKVGGNIGLAALDLLDGETPDFYVLELSSFQLETTENLHCAVALVLNITPDHMDRYDSYGEYAAAKFRICRHADRIVIGDELRVALSDWMRQQGLQKNAICFAKHGGAGIDWNLADEKGIATICHADSPLLPVSAIKLAGSHNYLNVMACLASLRELDIDVACAFPTLEQYSGLSHRMQPVRCLRGVTWYNDSKATNVGATIAAVEGIAGDKILIAGGLGKDAEFSDLGPVLKNNAVSLVLLYGKDAKNIAAAIDGWVEYRFADDLEQAVNMAAQQAQANSSVLFSPACASFDMFKNFEHRGDMFCHYVEALSE